MKFLVATASVLAATSALSCAVATEWEKYIHSPASRVISPTSIYSTIGDVSTASSSSPLAATLVGQDTVVTYDFGQQVSGFLTITFGSKTTNGASLAVAFSESETYIGTSSDNSTDFAVDDGVIYAIANPSTSFTFSREFARGSYRYVTVSNEENTTIAIEGISTYFTSAPHTVDDQLRDYTSYAMSLPMNREPTITTYGWYNNATIEAIPVDAEVYVDGAKRDRTPWAGDYGVSVLSKTVSLNHDNLLSVSNAIVSLFDLQTNGQFPYAGYPIGPRTVSAGAFSDTYHLWTLIALADYTLLSGNTTLVISLWEQAVLGVEFILNKVDVTDYLVNVTSIYDWGRTGQGGKNIAANALLYRTLILYAKLADTLSLSGASYNGTSWSELAVAVKSAINDNLWDESAGLYRDNTTDAGASLHPQDGNSLAVHFNVTYTSDQAIQVSKMLSNNWNEFGSVAPEGLGTISPFITSMEIDAHLTAQPGNASLAMEILRRQWGYMLNHFSNSTLIEGYYETGILMYPFYGPEYGSYISHAHAWSTGPVASLTLRIGGLAPVSDGGKVWSFQPHAAGSGLGSVQTGFSIAAGSFSVEWIAMTTSSKFFVATISTPEDTTGSISVPTFGKSLDAIEVIINSETVWKSGQAVNSTFVTATVTADFVTVATIVSGGSFTIIAAASQSVDSA